MNNVTRSRNALQSHWREHLENRILDAEIHRDELRAEILSLLEEHRYIKWFIRHSRAHLAYDDFLSGVRETFGAEVAAVVEHHSTGNANA